MNHEPECHYKDRAFFESCGECNQLRAAYQRGRDVARLEEAERWQETAHLAKRLMEENASAYQRGMESAAAMAETRYHDMKSCGKLDDCVVIAIGAWLVSEDIRFVLEGGDYAKAVREMRHEDNLLDSE